MKKVSLASLVNKLSAFGHKDLAKILVESEKSPREKRFNDLELAVDDIKRALEALNQIDYGIFVDNGQQVEFLDSRSTLEDLRDILLKEMLSLK